MLIWDYIVGIKPKLQYKKLLVPIEISGAINALTAISVLNKSISKENYVTICNK